MAMLHEILNLIIKVMVVGCLGSLAYYFFLKRSYDRYLIYLDTIHELISYNYDHEKDVQEVVEVVIRQIPREITRYLDRNDILLDELIIMLFDKVVEEQQN